MLHLSNFAFYTLRIMNRYTFLSSWQMYLLRQLGREFPFIEMMYIVYKPEIGKPLEALLSKRKNKKHIIREFDISGSEEILERQRHNNNGFHKWYSPNELSIFPTKKYEIHTVGIFKENENTVLMLSFASNIDRKTDLLYLFVDRDKLDFGMQSKKEALSVFEKQFIQTTIYHRLTILLEDQVTNINAYAKDRKAHKLLIAKYSDYKNRYLKQQDQLNEVLDYLIAKMVKTEEAKYNAKIIISPETRKLIGAFAVNLPQLEQNLQEAIERASLNFFKDEDIIVEEWDFEEKALQKQKSIIEHTERENIIIALMEDIEQSIVKTKQNKEKIVASNVVKYLDNKMTPQAITDYFKRYKKEIRYLYKDDKVRWKLLYDNFRPFSNAID